MREPFQKKAKKAEFTACRIVLESGEYFVGFQGKKSGTSAILTNMLGSTGLMVTSEDDSSKLVGDRIKVILLD